MKKILTKKKNEEEIYLKPKEGGIVLNHILDNEENVKKLKCNINKWEDSSDMYICHDPISVKIKTREKEIIRGEILEISYKRVVIKLKKDDIAQIKRKDSLLLKFNLSEGNMPEGFEGRVKIRAIAMINDENSNKEYRYVEFLFENTLKSYFSKRKWPINLVISSIFTILIIANIVFMRFESIKFFSYQPVLYGYSLITALYLVTRYIFGGAYKPVTAEFDFTPEVSIIIPCFNEERWIHKTITSCVDQDYPMDKLEVIIVDDCSNDNSVERIKETIEELKNKYPQYNIAKRVRLLPLKQNGGKRIALVKGVEVASHNYVTFVDSDSFLRPDAIKNIVKPFVDPKVGGVTGRTDVENTWTNYITKMQAVRYYVSFRIIKAAESIFDAVTCLSGPLSCYRKELVEKYKEDWLNQKFFGQPATFGDDRSMTNFILKEHRTVYQDNAICTTIVPSKFKVFLKQQMRWKRSWLRESLRAGSFMWKKEPFQAISFYAGFLVPILAPIIFLYNFIYIPIYYQITPLVFLLGIVLMSFLMSFVYLWFRKSSVWLYGIWFCIFYELILIWQMPIACVTFWKSTWGTRDTKEDLEAKAKKEKRKSKKTKVSASINE